LPMASGGCLVKAEMTYVAEFQCSEKSTRHYRHISVGSGSLASRPESFMDAEGTIPNIMAKSRTLFTNRQCMGVRGTEDFKIEGKKQFLTKGMLNWKPDNDVFKDVDAATRGPLAMPGLRMFQSSKKRMAAILANMCADWHMSAQAFHTTASFEAMLHGLHVTAESFDNSAENPEAPTKEPLQ